MFLVLLNYKKDISEVENYLEEHIDFLDKYYSTKKFIFSGRKNPRTGGVILMNAKDRDEVIDIISQDPFHREEVAEYEIIEFIPTKFDEDFASFIKN